MGEKAESTAELLAKSKYIRQVSWCRLAICRSAQLSTATSSTRCSQVMRDRWRFAPTVPLESSPESGLTGRHLRPIVSKLRWPQTSLS